MILKDCKPFSHGGFIAFSFLTKNSIKRTLKKNRNYYKLCPVLIFLTLALIDKIFEHFSTVGKLLNYRFAQNKKKYLRVNYKACKSQLFPLASRESKWGSLSPILPCRYGLVRKAKNAISQRARFAT
jgi:hypothetical protein